MDNNKLQVDNLVSLLDGYAMKGGHPLSSTLTILFDKTELGNLINNFIENKSNITSDIFEEEKSVPVKLVFINSLCLKSQLLK